MKRLVWLIRNNWPISVMAFVVGGFTAYFLNVRMHVLYLLVPLLCGVSGVVMGLLYAIGKGIVREIKHMEATDQTRSNRDARA